MSRAICFTVALAFGGLVWPSPVFGQTRIASQESNVLDATAGIGGDMVGLPPGEGGQGEFLVNAANACGSTQDIRVDSPYPDGWVIIGQHGSNPIWYYTIKNVTCAKFLDEENVMLVSRKPSNWVVTREEYSAAHNSVFQTIKYLAGAPFGYEINVVNLSWPSGWVKINESWSGGKVYYTIKNLNTSSNVVTASITNPSEDITVESGTTVSFVGIGSTNGLGARLSYNWNFGDGVVSSGTVAGKKFINTGAADAVRDVTFRVTDSTGVTGVAVRKITVKPVPPILVAVIPGAVGIELPAYRPPMPVPGQPIPPTPKLSAQFQARVTNSNNQAVMWSLVQGGSATISSTGLFSIPYERAGAQAYVRTIYVKATSVADPTKFDIASVTVTFGSSW